MEVGGKKDNGIREEGQTNKNMTRSVTNKEYEHLNSIQTHLKGHTHPYTQKNKIKFFVEQK